MPAPEFYDQALLDRFRPQLRYDCQYDYRAAPVETAFAPEGNVLRRRDGDVVARAGDEPPLELALLSGRSYANGLPHEATDCLSQAPDHSGDARAMEGDPRYRPSVYGRCVEDGGRLWLQYWFWFYYNPKNLFGFGRHEGDWEMIQLGLGRDNEPDVATYAQHNSGEARGCRDGGVTFEPLDGGRHPVVFVAPLSHASYFEDDAHPYLLGVDHPYGDGPRAVPPVAPFGDWSDWPGRWGDNESMFLGRLRAGPQSPGCQNPKWAWPAKWHDEMSRRRPRVLLGRAVHLIGHLTFPPKPEITATREGGGGSVRVRYRLSGAGIRAARHLYLTVHDGERVLESRRVRDAGREGEEVLLIPADPDEVTVYASAFNRLRQRSDLTGPVAAEPVGGA